MKRIFLLLGLWGLTAFAHGQAGYELVLTTDFEGEVVTGSIDSLIHHIRRGRPARVGWQLDFDKDQQPDFDHWVDAEFITILGGHVFTQIETIFMQGPRVDIPQVEIYPIPDQWTAVIGTNGKLLNRFIREKEQKIQLKDSDGPEAEAIRKRVMEMVKVQTWKVATFWSIMK